MALTKATFSMIDGAPINVLDYGADPTGVADSYTAFTAALAAGSYIYVPTGTYKISQTLSITGEKIFSGPTSTSSSLQVAVLNYTGTGRCIQAISAEFGGLCIRNFMITGGDGTGAYAIYSTRPQTVIENIHIEDWDNSGIALEQAGTGSQASWGTMVRQCKYIAPATANAYIGFQIDINGGHVTLDGCEAIRGTIGINIDQGQAINVYRCSFNLQCNTTTYPYSSDTRDRQCSIRLSGDRYKQAISIRECYIEGFTYGIYVEACESLSIEDNFIADVGISGDFADTPGSLIYLKPDALNAGYINNVAIRNNLINGSGNGVKTITIGENATYTQIYNNSISATGSTGFGGSLPRGILKEDGTFSYVGQNFFQLNPFIGAAYDDTNKLLADMFWRTETFTAEVVGSGSAGTYEIASQTSTYTVIGRQVTLNVYITMAAVVTGGGAGNLAINIPVAIRPKTGKLAYGSVMFSGVDYATAGASLASEVDQANHANTVWFSETTDAGAVAYVPISGVGANDVIAFSITYEY